MAERYLSTSGSDSNTGSLASPWKTLAGAAAKMAPGDTIRAAAGEYYGGFFAGSRPFHLRVAEGAEVRIARRDKAQALSLDGWTDGSLDGEGGRLIIGPVATPSVTDSATSHAAVQLPGSRNVVLRHLVAESFGDVGILTNRNAAGKVADDILIEDVEVLHNGEGIRIAGYGTASAPGAGAGIVLRRIHAHHNDRMVIATDKGGDDFGGNGITLQRCDGVRLFDILAHDNAAEPSPDYDWDGNAVEIYGATRCVVDGLTAYGNEGVTETGSDSSSPVPDGNVIRNFRVTGAINHNGKTPVFLLRASRGMVLEDGFIDVTGPGDVFRWAADSWGGDWSGSVLRRIVVRAPGATVFQTYGRELEGVTREEVFVLPYDLLAIAALSEDRANEALRFATAADAAVTAAAVTVAAAEARAELALEAARRLAQLSRIAAG